MVYVRVDSPIGTFFKGVDEVEIFDGFDADNDGTSDGSDSLVDDAEDASGADPDAGIPDWHPKSKHQQ